MIQTFGIAPPRFRTSQVAERTDCIDGLKGVAGSVAVIVTSPPYNIGIKYSAHDDKRRDYLPWMRSVFAACLRALKDDGHFFLQMGGTCKQPLIPQQVLGEAVNAGFVLQNEIIWVKNITVAGKSSGQFKPINSARFLNHTYEFIFHLTKRGDASVNPDPEESAWFIPYKTGKGKKGHPAMFPVALPERCIQFSNVPRGSLIVDPFVGSGSTLVACKNLGMHGIGFDIDANYVTMANERRMVRDWSARRSRERGELGGGSDEKERELYR